MNTSTEQSAPKYNDAFSKLGDLWTPYKTLLRTVNQYLNNDETRSDTIYISDLENHLKLFKQSFISLLINPPKNAKSREELRKGMEEGISVRGIGQQVLSRELYHETVIISDMFDLNEFIALDLLCTAQIQMSYYPDLPRGLVAVLLYYDGRKTVVSILRMLVQARKGVLWSLNTTPEVEEFITAYTDELVANGLFTRILELLKTLDISKEIEKLQQNLALGGPKHRKQVIDLFTGIRYLLADVLFLWSANCGLPKLATITLIQHLRDIKLEEDSAGTLDIVTLYLQMSLLSAFDLSILHTREDGETIVETLPILSDSSFVETVLKELSTEYVWQSSGLQALTLFGFSISLASLRLIPQGQKLQNAVEQEDVFIDTAINLKVFDFIHHVFLQNEYVYTEDLIYKKVHNLFTDFIILQYGKVKELRIKADENARIIANYSQAGLEAPPNLSRHFEQFLLALAKFYEKDPLKLELVLEYWNPTENTNQHFLYRSHSRAVSLFKFIRLSGDVVPSTLFVPYLSLLRSISNTQQAARNCFNLLKQTGSNGLSSSISWDHFFMSFSQYYSNLRQEAPPIHDTVYRRQVAYLKGITPQEVDGLHAVLKLITTIAEKDDFARLAFCEHPGWAPLNVFLGLISCSVPPSLKADLLLALAALSLSQETANQTWNNLEASQILATIPSTSSFQPRGIQTELDEIESRMEEYPLTKALLHLLNVLTDSGIPRTLGAGPRKPGFDPYLTFIINSVFLKYNSRSYKDPAEKWEVARICLRLFDKFLTQYEPEAIDFPQSSKPSEFNSPPGFHLMVQLNTKSEFLNLLLQILDEGSRLFAQHLNFPAQNLVQDCTELCLNMLHTALDLQNKFYSLINCTSCPILLTSLSKLLLSINPRTGRPDYVVILAQFVGYQATIPKQSLTAVRILTQVTHSTLIHSQFMDILLTADNTKEIRNVFVECLDERSDSGNEFSDATKKAIFELVRQCLPYNAPNLTHFLFGFDLRGDVKNTVFQLPGVLNFPRTCVHSLFSILRNGAKDTIAISSSVLEASYNMLYLLGANSQTSEPVLRLLRLQPNFLHDHVNACFKKINNGIVELNQMSWLLKTVAIELKVACCNKQLSYLKQLCQLLVGVPAPNDMTIRDEFSIVQNVNPESESAINKTTAESVKRDNFLVNLLTVFDFNLQEVKPPTWDYFEKNVLDNLLASCESDTMPRLINVKRLHKILVDELSGIQGNTAIGQRQAIMNEIQKILLHAIAVNNSRKTGLSVFGFVDAWRQVTEVLVLHLPYEILSPKDQQLLEIYLLESLLKKIVKDVVAVNVSNLISGAVLILLQNLRKCNKKEIKQSKVFEYNDTNPQNIIEMNSSSMTNILRYLVEWILIADITSQTLRSHLYGCLLTILHIYDHQSTDVIRTNHYVSTLDSSKFKLHNEFSAMSVSNADFMSIFGEKLVEILCNDCTSGKSIVEILAMSTFGMLISLSGSIQWISHISSKGYLKHMIEGILDSDADLRSSLEPEPDENNLRNLYLYEAKMKMIIRIATTRIGAERLLEQRVLSCLSNMRVFDLHPDISKHWDKVNSLQNSYIPNVQERYMLLWLPCLQLCDAVLTSLGTDNESAVVQITHFLLSHLDPVELILRSGNANISEESFIELSTLTSIIARTANNDLARLLDSNKTDSRSHLYRIQKLMLALLPKFVLSDPNIRELWSDVSTVESSNYQTSARMYYFMQIAANLLLYSRNVIANHNIEHSGIGVLFQPTLSDVLLVSAKPQNRKFEHAPSLGMIVQALIATVELYHREKGTCDFLEGKLVKVVHMCSVDLKEFVPMPQEMFDLGYMREDAMERLTEKVRLKQAQINHGRFIIEHCLYLLWAHLDYYMLKAIPKVKNYGLLNMNSSFNINATLPTNTETTWKVSTDDISNLKQGLVSIFNDSFSSKLIESADGQIEADKALLEALLRKIKRLVQFVPVK